nr:immunoglobulin heavy chain junction region [Mus musculus]
GYIFLCKTTRWLRQGGLC